MIDRNKEIEYGKLFISFIRAKNDHERDLVRKKIAKFTKENYELVDEIQSRRWTAYGS